MTFETSTHLYKNTMFNHPLYRNEYALLSKESKEKVQQELAVLFKKGLQIHNGYKEKFIKKRVDYWTTVENVSRKIYFDVINHQKGKLTSDAKISTLSGIPQKHPEFEQIITDATLRILRHQRDFHFTKEQNTIENTDKAQRAPFMKRIKDKLNKKSHLIYFGASAIVSAIGLKEIFDKHSDIIKPFLQSSTEKALNTIGQIKSDDAVTILASGASILGGAYIARQILKSRKNKDYNILKSFFLNRTR